jgi:PPOX class probable F420-dependent enzyme
VVPGGRGEGGDVLDEEPVSSLLDSRLIATLATLNADGTPHVVPMWFLWEGQRVLIPTSQRTRKLKNLERDPRATVMLDDSRGGFDLRGVTLVGRAEIVRGPEALELNHRIHLKYVTERGLGLDPVGRYLATDDVTIRFEPTRASSWDLRNTEQGRALLETGEFERLLPVHD